jgi:hypothetical protein
MKKIKYLVAIIFATALISSCKKTTCNAGEQDTFPFKCETGMDVAFVIDYTGSMGGAINNVKTNVNNIVTNIIAKSAGDYRLSLSIFDEQQKFVTPGYASQLPYMSLPAANKIINTSGLTTNQYLTVMENFAASNALTFGTQLAKLNTAITMPMGNGVGGPEPGGMLIDKLINSAFAGAWRPFKNRIVIIITDAQDGGDDDNNTVIDDSFLTTLATQANLNQVQCILVSTLPNSNYETKLISGNTGGLKLTPLNFTNISVDINKMIDQLCLNNNGK